jgi:hypothetical protein
VRPLGSVLDRESEVSIRIYKTDDRWWDYPYVVAKYDGGRPYIKSVALTRWGAHRIARKLVNKPKRRLWWECEYEEL